MSRDNASSFGALGMLLVKGVLGYILVRLGKSQSGLEVRFLCFNFFLGGLGECVEFTF